MTTPPELVVWIRSDRRVQAYLQLSMKVHTVPGMNKLPVTQRAQILSMLCEGASMRSLARLRKF